MKLFTITLILSILSFQAMAASWNFKKNLDASPPYNKCIEAIANGKDMGSSSLKNKSRYSKNSSYSNTILTINIPKNCLKHFIVPTTNTNTKTL